jgi:hypothetical protein
MFAHGDACAAAPDQSQSVRAEQSVPGDRWLEIDLYWFDHGNMRQSVAGFWERFAPLFENIQGERGLILNVGWTVGYIMEWNGDPRQRITLPPATGQQPWVSQTAPLDGDTATRMRKWKERFANPVMVEKLGYGPWTYADLGGLAALLRTTAKRHGVDNFKVGTLVYAWEWAYGEIAPWVKKHPESFSARVPKIPGRAYVKAYRYFDPGNKLHADNIKYAAYPDGYSEGTPVGTAFARQWGSLSKEINLDALMLRDSFGFMVPYSRRGRLGELMPSPDAIEKTTTDVMTFVRETKQANPRALVMMYSNAATAIGDWRANGCDLERVAKDGFLDIFVDQTWAGAWNEVGVRHYSFWNQPPTGWTYQLGYTLMHAAMLAGTRVKHYPLIETFDAWESWDVLHTAPQRLRWAIWAYSHAAIKTPGGIRMPGGSYISWANQGKRLLGADDVAFLSGAIGDAVRDAARTTEVFGPTLVYTRSAQEWQAANATPAGDVKQWIDEQGASIAKWPVPIMSATRVEWLSQVQTDLPIVQTPSHLADAEQAVLLKRVEAGKPLAAFGSFAGSIDPRLLAIAGIRESTSLEPEFSIHQAVNDAFDARDDFAGDFPREFPVQTALNKTMPDSAAISAKGSRVLYSVDGSAQLVTAGPDKNLLLWDPPDFRMGNQQSLKEIWGGGVAPYAMTAAAINELLRAGAALHAVKVELAQTGAIGAWRTSDGKIRMLAGNTEEGLRDDADRSRHFTMKLPAGWPKKWKSSSGEILVANDMGELEIHLPPDASAMIEEL